MTKVYHQIISIKLRRMSSLWTTNCLVFVICMFVISKSLSQDDSQAERKDPEYCNDLCSSVEVLCEPTNCTNKQVEGYKPELCRCCTECYTRLDEGDKCGDNDEAICDQGLTCRNNVCRKEAEPL
ncbi:uncharacterized protein LOC114330563 isoform X1 [Diabrotica virgifera virgifera]|uniref:Uncharacterized protein LOC114330563 isoform X1 n=1 Tax=Diabrotica virgifera virgifera TaxID=50390 RepID=A0A6P7FSH7_DIAVI|nr:uncharacterized protein LOC114330563 isoform X1 [Diabrotica virgifera virgifera]